MKGAAAAMINMEDDILSNLTSASASGEQAVSASSRNNNGGINIDIHGSCNNNNNNQGGAHPTKKKKKRGIPCNPDPDAEVIALSPKSLLATNRFTCEVCNKGFKRDQNLQLHRRGHNLPWKLKQRPKFEPIRRKVYVCPEPTCAHHEPSRALGDLTGIKKHFCRKHGEKRWKCDRCEKKYAVRSDWKAHSKVCGTREYKCDCGTVFSRRDSFITHRAFCYALTQETMMKSFASPPQLPPPFTDLANNIFVPPSTTHPPLNLHDHFFNHGNGFLPPPPPLPLVKLEPEHVHLPAAAFSQHQRTGFCFPENPNPSASSSAASLLLQEATVMGATTASNVPLAGVAHSHESFVLQDANTSMTAMMMMNSIAGTAFDGVMDGILDPKVGEDHVDENIGMTRDFLSMYGDDDEDINCMQHLQQGDDHHQHHHHHQVIWQG